MVCVRSEEHTSELQSHSDLVCRLLLEKKKDRHRPGIRGRRPVTGEKTPPIHVAHPVRRGAPLCGAHPRLDPASNRYLASFFFNDTATTEIYTLSLHDALPIWRVLPCRPRRTDRAPNPSKKAPKP